MRETYIDGGGNIPIRSSKTPKQKTRQEIIEEAYRMFPDVIEPVDYHPAGKIVVDRGNLRFAFLEGAQFVARSCPTEPLQCLRCGTVDAFGLVSTREGRRP